MADPPRAKAVLARLRATGRPPRRRRLRHRLHVAELAARPPPDELKIDKSFVMQMATDEGDAPIVRSTVQLGRSLGLKVVAEGVEDEATWDELRALGCDAGAGLLPEPAGPEAALTPWLRTAASTSPTGAVSAELTA